MKSLKLTLLLLIMAPATMMAQWSGTPSKVEAYKAPDGRRGVKLTYGTVKNFQPDRRFLELQGNVKTCLWQDGDNAAVLYTFGEHHMLMSAAYADGSGEVMPNIKRDNRARIVTYGSDEPSDMDGEVYKTTVTWTAVPDADGYPATISEPNPEGNIVTQLTFNRTLAGKAAHLTKKTIKATGMNYSGTVTYSAYVFDNQGNWTSRKAAYNLVCRADGNTPMRYTETQQRTITYWETTAPESQPSVTGNQPSTPSTQPTKPDGSPDEGGDKRPELRDTVPPVPPIPTPRPKQDSIPPTPPRPHQDTVPPPPPRPTPTPIDTILEEHHHAISHSIIEVADSVISLNNTDEIQQQLEKMGFKCEQDRYEEKDIECENAKYTDGQLKIVRKKKNKPALKELFIIMKDSDTQPVMQTLKRLGYVQGPVGTYDDLPSYKTWKYSKGQRYVEVSSSKAYDGTGWSLYCTFTYKDK